MCPPAGTRAVSLPLAFPKAIHLSLESSEEPRAALAALSYRIEVTGFCEMYDLKDRIGCRYVPFANPYSTCRGFFPIPAPVYPPLSVAKAIQFRKGFVALKFPGNSRNQGSPVPRWITPFR